ncbi:MAG: ribosome silencing factor [Candidatus Omnitrophica bacterium]|nr:ribosome silencing factor [Candidatus Omnitrophota bacterium]
MPGLRDGALPDPQAIAARKTSRQIALAAAGAALDAKAEQPLILDLRKVSYSFDFFFLCSAGSDRQIRAVVDHIEEALEESGFRAVHREGDPEGGWVLLDFGSVVCHIFMPEVREYYALERLWGDAPRLRPGKKASHANALK